MRRLLPLTAAILALGACGGESKIPGVGDDVIVHGTRIHPMPMRNRIIQQPPEKPSFTYYGGPLVANANIVEVLWGGGVESAAEMGRFYATIVNSEYFDLLSEYGAGNRMIGRGSFAGLVTHPSPPSGTTVDDEHVQDELARLLHKGTLPANDDDTVYVIHFPPGITITQGGAASCANFCAYHGSFRRNDKLVPYVVIPDLGGECSVGCGTADKLSNTTWVASHELAQVVTNPSIGFAGKEAASPLAWFDPMVGEISDACAGSADIGGFVVQTQWSRKDARCRFGSSQASTFTISVSPTAQSVRAGTSATMLVTTRATAPNAPTLTLVATGLPEGVTASFAPAEVLAGKTSVLTLEAAASAAAAITDVTVSGRASGGVMESVTAKLTVDSQRPGNDFSLDVTPVSRTLRRGATVKFQIKTAVISGDAEPIMLTVTGLPGGVTGSFVPPIVGAGSSSELTVSAGSMAMPGSALLTITAMARAKTRTATVSIDVEDDTPPVNDFMVAMTPGTRSVMAGESTTFMVTTAITSGQPQNVVLAASGLPPGTSAVFVPPMVTAGGSSTLTVSAAADAGASTTPFTVTGTASSGSRTTTATLTVVPLPPPNDFAVMVAPGTRSVVAGEATTFTVTTSVTSGNAVMVGFAISGLPTGVTATFEPSSVMAGEMATLRLSSTIDAMQGTAPLTITGSSATTSHGASAQVTVTAPPPSDFSVEIAPDTQNVTAGHSTTFAVTTAVISGRAETVTLTASGLPPNVTASFTPQQLTAGGTSTLKLTAASSAPDADKLFTVRAVSPTFTHNATATLMVTSLPPPNDFSLTVSPDTRDLLPGMMVTYSIATAVTSGSAQNVALSVEGLPAGVTASIAPMTVSAGAAATLTLTASPTAPATMKTFTVTGVATSGQRVGTAVVNVLPPPITNLIENGDFETGTLAGWSIDVGVVTNTTVAHHGGDHSARLGSSSVYVFDSALYQLIDVPSGKTTSLSFWAYPRCPEFWGSQEAYILDDAGFKLKTIFTDCDDSAAWEKITVDLTPYAGKSVYLYLLVDDFGFAQTWMYIDDVAAMSQ